MISERGQKVFATDKQIKFLRSRAKRKSFIGGRGSGKSHTLGYAIGMAYDTLPREKMVLAGLTYVQLDLIVLPVIREALTWMGIHEYHKKKNPYGQYVIGIKPPENWLTPKKPVGKLGYQYCMSFINGFTVQFVSQDRAETHRGLNVVGLLNDESATMSEDFIYKVLKKGVRGSDLVRSASSPLYKCHYDFSSASWTQEGMHIYKIEELWKKQIEERINWSQKQRKEVPPDFLFIESTCLDNPVTGQAYWDSQKEDCDPVEFAVEVANERIGTIPDGFYHAFKASHHTYWQNFSYQHDDKTGLTLWRSNDYREDLTLDVSLDFNADICWAVVGQEVGKEARVIASNYEKPGIEISLQNAVFSQAEKDKMKTTNIVKKQAQWFDEKYAGNETRTVYIYGDPGGNNRTATTDENNKVFFDTFSDCLIKKGWTVLRRELKRYPRHKHKYTLVNALLSEDSHRLPKLRLNQNTNKVLIITLQTTKVDSITFQKDKSSEKKTTLANRQYATDGTDALDYWLWAKFSKLMPFNTGFRHS
jgi:hypothetical protein